MSRRRRVVLACDEHPEYAELLPYTIAVWRHVAGYEPLVVWVGETRPPHAVERAVEVFVVPPVLGYPTSTTAQVVRLYAHRFAGPSDYLLTSDVDMWPLSRVYYHQGSDETLSHLYANAYGGGRYPMCYVGGPVEAWRSLFPEPSLAGVLTARLGARPSPAASWNLDEDLLSEALARVPFTRFDRPVGRPIGLPDRIDRPRWPETVTIDGKTDAHLPRGDIKAVLPLYTLLMSS